jgi:hypothetical protein
MTTETTTSRIYRIRVSLDLMVEAPNADAANDVLNEWVDVMGDVPNSPGVLGWDDIDSDDPGPQCSVCGDFSNNYYGDSMLSETEWKAPLDPTWTVVCYECAWGLLR